MNNSFYVLSKDYKKNVASSKKVLKKILDPSLCIDCRENKKYLGAHPSYKDYCKSCIDSDQEFSKWMDDCFDELLKPKNEQNMGVFFGVGY
tara:strand:+ start:521 stop:793 length:273 start_codon:yes stop_codon:yes gene_type:complete